MKNVLGCGIDIEELIRFKNKIPSKTDISGFAQSVYSSAEIECNLNLKLNSLITFPLCFSCKEAFFKALGVSWTNSKVSWQDIELLFNNENNLYEYSIRLNGFAKEIYKEIKCREIESCLEFTNKYVIFQVILLS